MTRLPLALALSLLALPALAEDKPVGTEPVTTTASYGDWLLRCQRIGEPARKVCEIVQTVQASRQGQPQQPVAQLAFGRLKASEPIRLTAHLPVNILLPSVAKFATGEKDARPVELPWRRCVQSGCFADAALTEAQWSGLHGQSENGSVEFTDAGARPVKFPISFRGFAQAADALAKE
ncbi:invasion protein IalB [Rhodoblastus acidophilus]|uniref:invasion associated locus B family protein n=1 Tax=Rhodoblastus acidophilus TaxID=1074 RepID=UPI0022255584|nr:invasion associated locus B family protein [Rhodoblastus acidophilus]MCW2283145.1 invasion protein IalB [Rhodoblastus acidophilus]MCW2331804.1 invasion protein IalB [Rhodoblastus acidophilus]